jgi:hypothetical protein
MTLWALRRAVLGPGPWLMITSERNLDRLMNSPRKRQPTKPDDWRI